MCSFVTINNHKKLVRKVKPPKIRIPSKSNLQIPSIVSHLEAGFCSHWFCLFLPSDYYQSCIWEASKEWNDLYLYISSWSRLTQLCTYIIMVHVAHFFRSRGAGSSSLQLFPCQRWADGATWNRLRENNRAGARLSVTLHSVGVCVEWRSWDRAVVRVADTESANWSSGYER